jgi:hypothetical protein
MFFAHLKRILRLDRPRLRGPLEVQDEFLLVATRPKSPEAPKLIPSPALQPAYHNIAHARLPLGSLRRAYWPTLSTQSAQRLQSFYSFVLW